MEFTERDSKELSKLLPGAGLSTPVQACVFLNNLDTRSRETGHRNILDVDPGVYALVQILYCSGMGKNCGNSPKRRDRRRGKNISHRRKYPTRRGFSL